MIVKHSLPGEGENSKWFEGLNAFEQAETQRQVRFKRARWPDAPDGGWSKKPDYTYPHILPPGDITRVFFEPIAQNIPDYCAHHDIAMHTEALNLRSSQVCCFNVMFPLRQDLALAAQVLSPMLPGVRQVTAIEFEYTGDKAAVEWMGEPSGGKRGQNRTSIDVAIWWADEHKRYLTLGEWKYTEKSFGTCGGYQSRGNQQKSFCRQQPAPAYATNHEACYLVKIGRHYWDRLDEAGVDMEGLGDVTGCPFMGPFYQLLRQHLLAAYLRRAESMDQVFVAVLHFEGNTSLGRTPAELGMSGDVIEAWNTLLAGVPKMQRVSVESIATALRDANAPLSHDLGTYLTARYGLPS